MLTRGRPALLFSAVHSSSTVDGSVARVHKLWLVTLPVLLYGGVWGPLMWDSSPSGWEFSGERSLTASCSSVGCLPLCSFSGLCVSTEEPTSGFPGQHSRSGDSAPMSLVSSRSFLFFISNPCLISPLVSHTNGLSIFFTSSSSMNCFI